MRSENKRISGKAIALIVTAALLLSITVGVVVAYLMAETPPVTNTFTPVSVSCEVKESFDAASNVKSDVKVENIGDISAYIRASIVVNWVSDSGSVYGGAPVAGTDYEIEIPLEANGWFQGKDGYYYYKTPVAAGDVTTNLIDTVGPVANAAPDGYTLSVQILATAIQSEPAEAVTTAWPAVTVNSDDTLAPTS